ncbi:MAG: hypothetical protein NW206_15580 [Hyphomonadaceae bacterium]|nr:hypothetical protein [Hyphomonadaceae bacterium]
MSATTEQLYAALSYCVEFARAELEASGDFGPFGSKVEATGKVAHASELFVGETHLSEADMCEHILKKLRSELADGHTIVIAVAAHVAIPDEYSPTHKDGIRVTLEARDYLRFIYVPYRLKRRFNSSKYHFELADPFYIQPARCSSR